ncbi:PH domain-containing protein [Legionella birminghamensis]|nr:PH domain-containing protein [Legionella birminghamensis]
MIDSNTDSNVVYVARLHWVIFLGPFLMACLAMLLGIYIEQVKIVALLFLLFALAWAAVTWVNYHFSSLTIRRKQVILRAGIMVRNTIDIPLGKIESIDIRQSIVGSLLRYGSLMITGTGGTRYAINFLDKPLTCRRYIEQLMHEP